MGAVVEIGGSGETAAGNGRRDFGIGKGAVAIRIRKTWQEQGRVEGGEHKQ